MKGLDVTFYDGVANAETWRWNINWGRVNMRFCFLNQLTLKTINVINSSYK